jgi:hypothetical protein
MLQGEGPRPAAEHCRYCSRQHTQWMPGLGCDEITVLGSCPPLPVQFNHILHTHSSHTHYYILHIIIKARLQARVSYSPTTTDPRAVQKQINARTKSKSNIYSPHTHYYILPALLLSQKLGVRFLCCGSRSCGCLSAWCVARTCDWLHEGAYAVNDTSLSRRRSIARRNECI